jgi:hypothetical protein
VAYSAGWKKLEPMWSLLVRARRIPMMLPALESVLSGLGTVDPQIADAPTAPPTARPSSAVARPPSRLVTPVRIR